MSRHQEACQVVSQRAHWRKLWQDSSTYQAILAEGGINILQETLLGIGCRLLGPPDKVTQKVIVSISDLERLRRMRDRLLDSASWQALLDTE
jgi:hypothetical protein